jgi:hypothetical protein
MTTARKPANKGKPATAASVKAEPGTVHRRKDAKALEARVAELEKLIDSLSLQVATAESIAQTALCRTTQLQNTADRDILGI